MAHAVFTRTVFKKLGYFHENRFAADWEYWHRLKAYQAKTKTRSVHLTSTGGYQWVHGENLTVLVPLRGEQRKRYVTKMRKDIEKMSKTESFYRPANAALIRNITRK